jgi:hypothetical protein
MSSDGEPGGLRVYIYAPPPHQGLPFFPISLTVSLRGQPSAICYLPKETKKHKKHKHHKNQKQTKNTKNKKSKNKNKKHKKPMHWRAFSPSPIPK